MNKDVKRLTLSKKKVNMKKIITLTTVSVLILELGALAAPIFSQAAEAPRAALSRRNFMSIPG